MRKLIGILLLLTAFSGFCQITARIIRVKDGDTFVGLWNGRKHDCRIANIDAPELKQYFGTAAKDSLSKYILGKVLILDSLNLDIYGRNIVSLKIGNKRLDSISIRNGWAWQYIGYNDETLLANAMQDAILEGKGLWKCGLQKVCPPWIWRHLNARNKRLYEVCR
ncbi:MAG: thermonuclease family protein [Bacteroidota bacterium]|nr:thermonuclease family protein [Bacteroidota bacterium]